MRYFKKMRGQAGAVLLSAVLMCSAMPISVLADIDTDIDNYEGAICHAGMENCAYVEAVKGEPCAHEHGEECYGKDLNCIHEHGDACEEQEETASSSNSLADQPNCQHQHDDDCYVDALNCGHTHDGACGYVKAVKGVRCDHECEICDLEKEEGIKPEDGQIVPEDRKVAVPEAKAESVCGDFTIVADAGMVVSFDESYKQVSIKGSGKVTIGMKEGVTTTSHGIVIWGDTGSPEVFLDGVTIDVSGDAPIRVKGSKIVYVDLVEGTENNLTAHGEYAAIEVANVATLHLGKSVSSTGTLVATAESGTAIGGGYRDDCGNIIIAAGTIEAKSEKGTGIGGGDDASVKQITIGSTEDMNSPVNVTVEAGGNGIGAGRDGVSGAILITGNATEVNVTAGLKGLDGNGIGAGDSNKTKVVDSITISAGANVTINKSLKIGIGVGEDSKVGPITISDSSVTIKNDGNNINWDAGIGSGFASENGAITISNSEISITNTAGSYNYTGIGNIRKGVSGPIAISDTELTLVNGRGVGIGATINDTSGITLTNCTTNMPNTGGGIAATSTDASKAGRVTISGGTLDISGMGATGINMLGNGGKLDLKDNCEVNLNLSSGIFVGEQGELNVTDSKLTYGYNVKDSGGRGIGGLGNVNFYEGSEIDISNTTESMVAAISLSGKNSSVTFSDGSLANINSIGTAIQLSGANARIDFQSGCKVELHINSSSAFGYAAYCQNGIIHTSSGADVTATGGGDSMEGIKAKLYEGDACILTINSRSDMAGQTFELRDEKGESLKPPVTYSQPDSYQTLVLKAPGSGKYTLFINEEAQEFTDPQFNKKTVLDVFTGMNKPAKIEGGSTNVPVTGITLDKAITLDQRERLSLIVKTIPSNATNRNITVTSSDENIVRAWVDSNSSGTIWLEGKVEGTATVTVKTVDGGHSADCVVTVSKREDIQGYQLIVRQSYASNTGAGIHAFEEEVQIHAGSRTGYKFVRWSTTYPGVVFDNPRSPDTTFIMPKQNIVVEAVWEKESSNVPSKDNNDSSDEGETTYGSWVQDAVGWKYIIHNKAAAGQWAYLSYNTVFSWYYFDQNGYMMTGWLTDAEGRTYYLHPIGDGTRGRMYTGWNEIDGKWYYFSEQKGSMNGILLKNTATPDGYTVDGNGVWVR